MAQLRLGLSMSLGDQHSRLDCGRRRCLKKTHQKSVFNKERDVLDRTDRAVIWVVKHFDTERKTIAAHSAIVFCCRKLVQYPVLIPMNASEFGDSNSRFTLAGEDYLGAPTL